MRKRYFKQGCQEKILDKGRRQWYSRYVVKCFNLTTKNLKEKQSINQGEIMVDKIARASLLYDFYGALLTEKQRSVMALYHEENLSLQEIAEEYNISRQAVHDTLKKAEQALEGYEEKLGLIEKLNKAEEAVKDIDLIISEVEKHPASEGNIKEKLSEVRNIINSIEF